MRRRPTVRSKSAPTSSSAPTAAVRLSVPAGGWRSIDLGAPIDVLWLRLSKKPTDPAQGWRFQSRPVILVLLDRGDYWQCAYRHSQGRRSTEGSGAGLDAFRAEICDAAPVSCATAQAKSKRGTM